MSALRKWGSAAIDVGAVGAHEIVRRLRAAVRQREMRLAAVGTSLLRRTVRAELAAGFGLLTLCELLIGELETGGSEESTKTGMRIRRFESDEMEQRQPRLGKDPRLEQVTDGT